MSDRTWMLCVLCCLFALPADLAGQDRSDVSSIRETIERYVVGWRTGDLELLAEAFAVEEGVVLWRSGDPGQQVLDGMTFEEILARGSRPNPGYGEPWEILDLDVVDGALAVAKVEISRSGGSYVDYLVLYKLARGWRIVTKTFVTR